METLLVVIAIRGYARCPLPRALDAKGLENVERVCTANNLTYNPNSTYNEKQREKKESKGSNIVYILRIVKSLI